MVGNTQILYGVCTHCTDSEHSRWRRIWLGSDNGSYVSFPFLITSAHEKTPGSSPGVSLRRQCSGVGIIALGPNGPCS